MAPRARHVQLRWELGMFLTVRVIVLVRVAGQLFATFTPQDPVDAAGRRRRAISGAGHPPPLPFMVVIRIVTQVSCVRVIVSLPLVLFASLVRRGPENGPGGPRRWWLVRAGLVVREWVRRREVVVRWRRGCATPAASTASGCVAGPVHSQYQRRNDTRKTRLTRWC